MVEQTEVLKKPSEAETQHQHTVTPTVLMKQIRILSSDGIYADGLATSSFSYKFAKRLVDIVVSGAMILVLAPIYVFIILAIKFSSPGPVLYRERRVGRFGRHFTIYKFRSMYTKEYLRDILKYQEDETTQMQRRISKKRTSDPRITKVGLILRKLSLDELPQLINILKGDMSLIGPRPVVDAELLQYGDYALFYKLMYPGLSGLWQVSGRSNTSYQRRVWLDVTYCQRWSLLMDLKILLRTIPVVFQGRGAY